MNSYGDLFKITVYGGSHEEEIGLLIEGVPSGLNLSPLDFVSDLKRRNPASVFTTPRKEEDEVLIRSGVYNGYTTGGLLALAIKNKNTDSKKYEEFYYHPRPGHADFTQLQKSKYQNINGGGICSGRMTTLLVLAGVVAKKIYDFNVKSSVIQIGEFKNKDDIVKALELAKASGDSLGGIISLTADLKAGLGDPFFNSIESEIAHLFFSIPGVKGVEFGTGFSGVMLPGSKFNDLIIDKYGKTKTNNSGGINGGISNGNELVVNVAIRPPASIFLPQETYNFKTGEVSPLLVSGRHDTTFVYRSLVVFEACLNIVLLNFYLRSKLFNN